MTNTSVEDRDDEHLDEDAAPDASADSKTQPPRADLAPRWIVDMRRSEHRVGYYRSLGEYALQFTDRGDQVLVISFDNLSAARDDGIERDSWGYGFVAKNGWSHLGVLSFGANWFRSEDLFAEMRALAKSGFFRRFRRVVLTGTSMGGYAACAFASLVPGCTVLAFSPQASLDQKLVPWERRFPAGRKMDWSGDFANAAREVGAAAQVWLVYDPHFEEDRLHIEMFSGPNIRLLKTRYAGHKTALILPRANLLSTVVRETVRGEMTPARFYRHYRTVRSLPWFAGIIADKALARRHFGLSKRMVMYLRRSGQGFLAHKIRQKHIEAVGGPVPPGRGRPGGQRPRPAARTAGPVPAK